MTAPKRVCILSFSEIQRDARVLRQVKYLAPHYALTVIGHGERPNQVTANMTWMTPPKFTSISKALGLSWFALGRVWRRAYDIWFWRCARHRAALQAILDARPDAIHANDWPALPIAVEAAKRLGNVQVVFDAHEYAPLEREESALWRALVSPAVVHFLRKYADRADASFTVAGPIAERYAREFGFKPEVLLNTPRWVDVTPGPMQPGCIRLIHHGGLQHNRHPELMIEALAHADARFTLDLMFVGDTNYLAALKALADRIAPGRVTFRPPVAPADIVPAIAAYDIGIFLLKPNNYNYSVALPNKLFDFMAAGLAVCVGPSPAMAALVKELGCGVVAPSFYPHDVAEALNRLTDDQVCAMKQASRRAAETFNADLEMGKLVAVYRRMLEPGSVLQRQ